jgi:hypothetical protein
MALAAVVVLFAQASMPTTQAGAPLARDAAMSSTEARAPEVVMPVQSLGYVVFDWSEADGTIPGFGPLSVTGDSSGGR